MGRRWWDFSASAVFRVLTGRRGLALGGSDETLASQVSATKVAPRRSRPHIPASLSTNPWDDWP